MNKEQKNYINTTKKYPLLHLILNKQSIQERLEKKKSTINIALHEKLLAIYESEIEKLLPHGSGIDNEITIETIKPSKIVFLVPFHHLNEAGYYIEWCNYRITIQSEGFDSIYIKVSNLTHNYKDTYFIYDYLAQLFLDCITEKIQ